MDVYLGCVSGYSLCESRGKVRYATVPLSLTYKISDQCTIPYYR